MSGLKLIQKTQQNRYDKIIEYLQQDNEYWLNNDKWDFMKEFFIGKTLYSSRYVDFTHFNNEYVKNEIKYFMIFNFKERILKGSFLNSVRANLKLMANFFEEFYENIDSLDDIMDKNVMLIKWENYLLSSCSKTNNTLKCYKAALECLYNFIKDFYDEREETQKDIWQFKNLNGAKASASQMSQTSCINFTEVPLYYRDTVKLYLKTIITKKSFSTCFGIMNHLNYFFNVFYSKGYKNRFIEDLSRKDIESYLYWVNNDYRDKNSTYKSKFVSYIRTFLEYIQIAQYDKAPIKDVSLIMFNDDIPKRELSQDVINRVKFIPEPILKQIDNNIMSLDSPLLIPIYILLRETGWRGADILNLRFHNCIEQIWNSKDKKYNYYLCGEITKTGIAKLKIPIRDKVAEMVYKCIENAKEKSTEDNNPNKYLFSYYEGKNKGIPFCSTNIRYSIQRLINKYDIKDADGSIYHFRLHSLRHTRAKEYCEQGMGISIIQQILGHRSLQMTVHYATVTENTLYEKWKATEDLDLFKVNVETHELERVDLTSVDGKNLIRYEYIKKNLDAVKVPFGVCFKPSKVQCKQQMNFCLTCASFCTTIDNIPEYEEEIEKVKKQIDISEKYGRELWVDKNKEYLKLLEETLDKIKQQKIVHKNGASREDVF